MIFRRKDDINRTIFFFLTDDITVKMFFPPGRNRGGGVYTSEKLPLPLTKLFSTHLEKPYHVSMKTIKFNLLLEIRIIIY